MLVGSPTIPRIPRAIDGTTAEARQSTSSLGCHRMDYVESLEKLAKHTLVCYYISKSIVIEHVLHWLCVY